MDGEPGKGQRRDEKKKTGDASRARKRAQSRASDDAPFSWRTPRPGRPAWPPARTGSRAWRRSCEAWSSATVIVKLSLAPGLFYSSTRRAASLGKLGDRFEEDRDDRWRGEGRARRTRESPENLHDVFITKALRAKAALHAADVSLEYTSRARGRDDRCLLRSSPSPVRPESPSVSNPKIALGWIRARVLAREPSPHPPRSPPPRAVRPRADPAARSRAARDAIGRSVVLPARVRERGLLDVLLRHP